MAKSKLMPPEEALARILEGAVPLGVEQVPVADTYGRVLAEDLAARRTQPPAAMSAMDGYAVRAADIATVPVKLKIAGEAAAGRVFPRPLAAGEAVRIFTGGVVPPGSDTISIQENTRRDGDVVEVLQSEKPGRHIRKQGLDFSEGDVRLKSGQIIGARHLALAAAMNYAAVPVVRRPCVAMFSTGDELVMPGSETGPGQIILSNGFAIAAIARREGALALDLGIVPDAVEATIAAIRRARAWGADVLVTTGGASVGDYDLVQKALSAEGMELAFWKIAVRPGKPLMSGKIAGMRVIGLPGNPVSAVVCSELFLVPLLRALGGFPNVHPTLVSAVAGRNIAANDERQDYMRARMTIDGDGRRVVVPVETQDSSMMSALAMSECLLVRAPHAPPLEAGAACEILLLE
ncbi:molybdopterin molybdenumtransferase [Variibacter gotjawalensis]|uniref:Molybdopterin molybdenumtransferase n=1 Tax=Variibacter gotjawalensis TaxID=1333996 RepID=A0A0S3PWM7_9BRAD|nr:gephyrin-like molybdotransferase Glp [Variibacter gotjawalensis]NIK46118.1 molybdopterin molybdotransferase [Variibacter gotjawalensis]RZS48036.1 molybdopterin molybdochelatase [Variibacter gotjawalensis]BAT60292.1 molybdopterin molybdenumtransferase [Variibacter gotjawalensis]